MKLIIRMFLGICLGVCLFSANVLAATPRVMVSDYQIKEERVIGGKEFTLKITLENTAAKAVKNVKLSLSTENGEILPADGAGTAYIAEIAANSKQDFSFKMKAVSGLEEKAYKISVKTEYESSGGMGYTVDEAIFLPVFMEQRVSVSDFFTDKDDFELGDTVELSATVNNMGEGTLYNVLVKAKGDNIKETSTYLGNIASGKNGIVDILTKATVVTEGDHKNNKIVVTYEDKEGNVSEQEVKFEVAVSKPLYEKLEKVKKDDKGIQTVKLIVEIIVVIAVLAGGIFFYIKWKKRKKAMLEEFIK